MLLYDSPVSGNCYKVHEGGFDLSGRPAIQGWLERVAARPGHVPITA